jgi:hypothetical protein
VLSLAPEAEALEPPELREQIAGWAAELAAWHADRLLGNA